MIMIITMISECRIRTKLNLFFGVSFVVLCLRRGCCSLEDVVKSEIMFYERCCLGRFEKSGVSMTLTKKTSLRFHSNDWNVCLVVVVVGLFVCFFPVLCETKLVVGCGVGRHCTGVIMTKHPRRRNQVGDDIKGQEEQRPHKKVKKKMVGEDLAYSTVGNSPLKSLLGQPHGIYPDRKPFSCEK